MCQNDQQTVVLAYDMDTTHNANINTEIKDILTSALFGWEDAVDACQPIVDYCNQNAIRLPSTTLIKRNTTLDEAEQSFRNAMTVCNTKHAGDGTYHTAQWNNAILCVVEDIRIIH